MGKVVILTDSSSGIRQVEAQQLGISVLPMPFFINGETLFEDINLTQDTFYEHLTDGAEISTSMPAVGDLTDSWDELLKEYDEIVYIPLSSVPKNGRPSGKRRAKSVTPPERARLLS